MAPVLGRSDQKQYVTQGAQGRGDVRTKSRATSRERSRGHPRSSRKRAIGERHTNRQQGRGVDDTWCRSCINVLESKK